MSALSVVDLQNLVTGQGQAKNVNVMYRKWDAVNSVWSDPMLYKVGNATTQLVSTLVPLTDMVFMDFVRIFGNLRLSGDAKVLYAFREEIDSKKLVA